MIHFHSSVSKERSIQFDSAVEGASVLLGHQAVLTEIGEDGTQELRKTIADMGVPNIRHGTIIMPSRGDDAKRLLPIVPCTDPDESFTWVNHKHALHPAQEIALETFVQVNGEKFSRSSVPMNRRAIKGALREFRTTKTKINQVSDGYVWYNRHEHYYSGNTVSTPFDMPVGNTMWKLAALDMLDQREFTLLSKSPYWALLRIIKSKPIALLHFRVGSHDGAGQDLAPSLELGAELLQQAVDIHEGVYNHPFYDVVSSGYYPNVELYSHIKNLPIIGSFPKENISNEVIDQYGMRLKQDALRATTDAIINERRAS